MNYYMKYTYRSLKQEGLIKLNFIISMTIFGTIGIFVRNLSMPSSVVAFVRALVGAIFLLLYYAVSHRKINYLSIKKNLFLLSILGIALGLNWVMLFEAYRYTSVATATVCYYLSPVFLIIAARILFKEKISLIKGMSVLVSLLGVAMISFSNTTSLQLLGSNHSYGILFGIGAAVFYSLIIVVNRYLKEISGFDRTFVQLGVAAFVLFCYIINTVKLTDIVISKQSIFILMILGIIHTGISFTLYFSSIAKLNSQTISILSYIDPIVAILVSIVFLHEPMYLQTILGAGLVLGSTCICEVNDLYNHKKCISKGSIDNDSQSIPG